MRAAESLDFRLDRWAREARELATCVECYGVGEDRDAPGRACPACSGRGRAAREPHVLELVAMVRDRDARLEAAAQLAAAESTSNESRVEELLTDLDEARSEIDYLRSELYRLRDELHRSRRREGED